MNRVVSVVLLLVLSGYLSSCSVFKNIRGKKRKHKVGDTLRSNLDSMARVAPPALPSDTTANADSAAKTALLIEQYKPYWTNRLAYKTFSGKAKVHYETPGDSKDFTAHIRLRKDSVIWVEITALGIPLARVFITQDSIFLLDKYHNEATLLSLGDAAKMLPTKVDFSSLQNLIVGEPLRNGSITNVAANTDSVVLQVEDDSYVQQVIYNTADSTIRRSYLYTRNPGPGSVSEYNNYQVVTGRKLSLNRLLHIQNGNDTYILDLDLQRTDFDEALDYPFSIPKNFKIK